MNEAASPARAAPRSARQIVWQVSDGLEDYPRAVAAMEAHVAGIRAGAAPERVWLLEHPPLYTAGTSARAEDLLDASRLPVYRTGRGGQFTYHGPGQRVGYVMLDLRHHGQDVRSYVRLLEDWLIRALAAFDVKGERRADRVGVWIHRGRHREGDDKIAAIGVRVRQWVSYHGVALNVAPDLSHYAGIVPCGVRAHGVTSLAALGVPATLAEVDVALAQAFAAVFAIAPSALTPPAWMPPSPDSRRGA
ncbi:MAG: lipoyl(octanoyl) transferase LipB [Alphaproteobacteria bacterium]|nr:lipoyl(octanoyl) transferase LipB [Alphaproteobacteria bacterium]